MGTICKYAVVANQSDVVECVTSFLRANQKDFIQTIDPRAQLGHPGSQTFFDRFPPIWSASETKEGIVEVYVNSWERRSAFASFASFQLQTRLVVNNYQSTADGCYWAFYLDGECRREIETTEEPLFEARGEKLSFEREHMGTNIAEDEEDPFFVFSYEDMDFYNEGVGVDIDVYQSEPHSLEWTNWTITDPASGTTRNSNPSSTSLRPRRFWSSS